MPDTISFTTFMTVVITEFCLMAALLVIIIDRSFKRAFKHLEEKTALREEIVELREKIGVCEKHDKLNCVVDTFCENCYEEYKKEKG